MFSFAYQAGYGNSSIGCFLLNRMRRKTFAFACAQVLTANSIWWLPISASLTTTNSGFPANQSSTHAL
jgi:hypothetical protein